MGVFKAKTEPKEHSTSCRKPGCQEQVIFEMRLPKDYSVTDYNIITQGPARDKIDMQLQEKWEKGRLDTDKESKRAKAKCGNGHRNTLYYTVRK